jgi:hypothetical protein
MRRLALIVALPCVAVAAGGCGSSTHTAAQSTSTAATSANPSGPGALQAEANSAAAGDIPDNQVFLVFRNDHAGYSMKYPEGWAQRGSGRSVVFRDKNNIARIVVATGPALSKASVARELRRQKGVRVIAAPQAISGSGKPLLKAVYSTESTPNSVTGKRVTLVVDRYYLWNGGRRAIVDLGTPQGVDNVDAYRLMIESFRWR